MTWLLRNFIKILCFSVSSMPRRLQLFTGRVLGLIWFYLVPVRRGIALQNLALAFPEKTPADRWKIAKDTFLGFGCGFIEMLMLPYMDDALLRRLFVFHGRENYDKAFFKNKGVFLLTLHLGSWELMSASQGHVKIPLNVITKKFKAKSFNDTWVGLRRDQGIKLISEEKSTFQILRAIGRGEAVGFILDQFMGPPVGSRVQFFGNETGAPASLALFSDRTRAPVVPVYNVRGEDGKIHVYFEPEIPFVEQGSTSKNISFMTQLYTSKLEEIVRKYPSQWLWIHRRWKPFRE